MNSVSRDVPHIKILHMRPTTIAGFYSLDDAMISQATKSLARFTGLMYLELDFWVPDEDNVLATLHTWMDACSTLEACSSDAGAWRKVDGTWQEFPKQDFPALTGHSWKISFN
ncbi:hypothetical protein FB451DRAFT_1361544 [Mycena latifolia]|nr:hypothetical protein FB451DRAFT_1361544 [Mycena latifolia]